MGLDCYWSGLDDIKIKGILKAFITNSNASLLTSLDLAYNSLTQVPDEIHLFPQLRRLNLASNQIHKIHRGALNFSTVPIHAVWLDYNQITSFEPGAIQSYFNINLEL